VRQGQAPVYIVAAVTGRAKSPTVAAKSQRLRRPAFAIIACVSDPIRHRGCLLPRTNRRRRVPWLGVVRGGTFPTDCDKAVSDGHGTFVGTNVHAHVGRRVFMRHHRWNLTAAMPPHKTYWSQGGDKRSGGHGHARIVRKRRLAWLSISKWTMRSVSQDRSHAERSSVTFRYPNAAHRLVADPTGP